MKKRLSLTALLAVALLFSGCQTDEPLAPTANQELRQLLADLGGKEQFLLPDSDDYSAIPQDPNNPLYEQKVRLGRLLFHETGLGATPKNAAHVNQYSCASCHFAGAGFQAGRFQGIGEGGTGFGFNGERRSVAPAALLEELDVQPIRTPAALNVAYQEVMLWNGQFGATGINAGTEDRWTAGTPIANNWRGFQGVETQALAGLGVHRLMVNADIVDSLGYRPLFDAAFPMLPESERYEVLPAALAIAAYERTLLANEAPFQLWLRGNPNAMTEPELRGAMIFFGKGGCNSCHTGPALNSMSFHALGMSDLVDCPEPTFGTSRDNSANLGRGGFTGIPADNYRFKTPQLYSLARSPFYGHGASFRTLREVVEYKNFAVAQNAYVPATQLSATFQPKGLTQEEIDDLVTFLSSGLNDNNLRRYEPATLPSGLCFPNNDDDSRADIGCN